MNQIHAMRVFVRVAETESFRRAARQLSVSNALVTRSIATLEAHLNTRLINRTTRALALTEAGTRYLEGCRGLLEELDRLEGSLALTQNEPGGTLRLVASGAGAQQSLTPLLDAFRRLYPKVNVRLTLTDQPVDLLEGGYDAGIVNGFRASGHELVERALGHDSLVVCASHAYLTEHGQLDSPEQLSQHALIASPGDGRETSWHFTGPDEHADEIRLKPVYTVNSVAMVRLGALAGMGVAILPLQLVADDLAAGTLQRLMPDHRVDDPNLSVSLIYPNRQFLPAKTRAFVEHALEHFRPGLEQTRTAPTLGEVATQVSAQSEAQATAATTSVRGVQLLGGGNPNSLHAPWDA
ncbi:LysR family transcriptional regulator [Paraburkholderia sp. DHOC27]|uniref:LysR family transcriptional regulator n=1 Tax=Paraburkholderia sp. DHOC27 TaxID=2303330 RepID=UPI000E3C04E5|nr:LysR family transcriptional regulator [Paraburkholderia sp. DHOC27]RFU45923.1 LysR family transcriptional regulator [Paraburkholderia sp. DHOC27]